MCRLLLFVDRDSPSSYIVTLLNLLDGNLRQPNNNPSPSHHHFYSWYMGATSVCPVALPKWYRSGLNDRRDLCIQGTDIDV